MSRRAKPVKFSKYLLDFPPAAYTARGVGSVDAAARAVRIVPEDEPDKLAA